MRAIALNRAGELELIDGLTEPHPSPDEVKIKMLAGGVCGSDLHSIASGIARTSYPWAIGHEGGGVVVEVGADVTSPRVGDLVVVEPNFVCTTCYWCLRGESKMCDKRIVVGAHVPGLFCEYTTVPAPFARVLPPNTPKTVMATLEPAVVAHRAVDRYLPSAARNALVIGAGSQGLLVIQRLSAAGYTPAVSEPSPANLAAAVAHGGRDLHDAPGEFFDLVFETSGAAAGYLAALDRAEKLAQICLIGQPAQPVPTAVRPIVQKELTIRGHLIYNHPHDFGSAITAYAEQPAEPPGLRPPVAPAQAVHDIRNARTLPGKIWIDLENWDGH